MPVFAANTPSPWRRGEELARYELLCPIAEGGMACVWAARPRGSRGVDRIVAIKTILPRFADDARFRRMFLEEGHIASRVAHPNVARILELGEEHGVLYMVMEYIDGDPLAKLDRVCRNAGTSVPTGIVLRILADVCAGLHEAHELVDGAGHPLGLVHHDVSPHNILVSTAGVAKLIDFGIAKTASARREDSFSGVLKGKIQYMAPEQALGQPMDRRADVWAIGAILYFLLSGRPPYDGKNHVAILNRLASGCPPLPLSPAVPVAVAAVARIALAHAPEGRYASAEDLRRALEGAMIEARAAATPADVAAFAAVYLAARAARRRDAIDLASARTRHAATPESPVRLRPLVRAFVPAAAGLVLVASGVLAGAAFERARASRADLPDPPPSMALGSSAIAAIAASHLAAPRSAAALSAVAPAGSGAPPILSRRRTAPSRVPAAPSRGPH